MCRIKKYEEKYWYRGWRGICYYYFRYDPIPGTGSQGKYGNWYRRMKTTQERRINKQHCKEFRELGLNLRIRGERMNLPEAWDDFLIQHNRNWKKQRKKRRQWMK